jgi:hypothetical protein
MAVLLRESSVTTTGSGGAFTISLTKPTGTIDGDRLFVFIQTSTSAPTLTPPAGWTLVDDSTSANLGAFYYTKVAASEGSNFDFTGNIGGNFSAVGICVALYDDAGFGTPTTSPYTETTDASADTTADNTGVTPTATPGSLLLVFIGSKNAQVTASTYAVANNNPTWTELQDTSTNFGGETCSGAAAYAVGRDLITATGAFTATLSGSAATTVYLVSSQAPSFAFSANLATLAGSGKSPSETSAQTATANLATLASSGKSPTSTQGDPTVANVTKNNGSWTNVTKHSV